MPNPTIDTVSVNGTTYDLKDKNAMPIVSYGEETVLVNTTTVSFSKDGDNDWYISPQNPLNGFTTSSYNFNVLYKIIWDGVEYDEYCVKHQGYNNDVAAAYMLNCIGSSIILGWSNRYETTAPFAIASNYNKSGSSNYYIYTTSTAASHTIKITSVPLTITLVNKILYDQTYDNRSVIYYTANDGIVIGQGQYAAEGGVALGGGTKALGDYSTALGLGTEATGKYCLVSGANITASGNGSLSTGVSLYGYPKGNASGAGSVATGGSSQATGDYSVAMGQMPIASGGVSFAIGDRTEASGSRSFAAGEQTISNHRDQFVFGQFNVSDTSQEAGTTRGNYVEIVGNGTATDARSNARTLDWDGNEVLAGKLTVGAAPTNNMDVATKQYVDTADSGKSSATNWVNGSTTGSVRTANSAAEDANYTIGNNSVAEGLDTKATGQCAHAGGNSALASGHQSFAHGSKMSGLTNGTVASGNAAVALGGSSTASGTIAFAMGQAPTASGAISFAIGDRTTASGDRSFASGDQTIANHRAQTVIGQFNIADPSTEAATARGNYVEIVGNGTSGSARSNARTLDWDGNEVLAGTITATNIPAPPNSNGTYYLTVVVNNGALTYSWSAISFQTYYTGSTAPASSLGVNGDIYLQS